MVLQEAYNRVKNHPYLLTFDSKYIGEFKEAFYNLEDVAYRVSNGYNKQFTDDNGVAWYNHTWLVLLSCFIHDLNRDIYSVQTGHYTSSSTDFDFGGFVIRLNNVISICHAMIEEREILSMPSGNKHHSYELEKGEHGYHIVDVGDERYIEAITKMCERELEIAKDKSSHRYANEYYENVLKDIKSQTGMFYRLKS